MGKCLLATFYLLGFCSDLSGKEMVSNVSIPHRFLWWNLALQGGGWLSVEKKHLSTQLCIY